MGSVGVGCGCCTSSVEVKGVHGLNTAFRVSTLARTRASHDAWMPSAQPGPAVAKVLVSDSLNVSEPVLCSVGSKEKWGQQNLVSVRASFC